MAVYENMLRADPDNHVVRRRIAEIQGADPGLPRETQRTPEVVAAARPLPKSADPKRRVIQGLQNWLIGIQKG